MKKYQLLFFILMFCNVIFGQTIYISSTSDNLYRLDINTCTYEFVVKVKSQVFDISFHPNGNLYGISRSGNFYEIDIVTGETTIIHDFNGQFFNSLTIDEVGRVYTIGHKGELWSYEIASDTEVFYGTINFSATGDLTFYNGDLYVAVTGNRIVQVDFDSVENSDVAINENLSGEIWGIVSYSENCGIVDSYAITDGNSQIYQIDFDSKSLSLICQLDVEIGGGASTSEFLAASPLIIQDPELVEPTCNMQNGSIIANAIGGFGNLEYSIDGNNYQSDPEFLNLGGGFFTLSVKDENDCIQAQIVELSILDVPMITNITVEQATCNQANGIVNITAEGGVGQIEFSIDGENFQTDGIFDNLNAGIYTVTLRDETNCTDSQQFEVEVSGVPILNLRQVSNTSCGESNGAIEVDVLDGTLPFQYALDGSNFQTDSSFDNLDPGEYIVSVLDDNNCEDSISVLIESSEVPVFQSVDLIPTKCGESNGAITINAEGGKGDIQYSIDGADFIANNSFTDIEAGEYTLIVKDDDNCTSEETVMIGSSPSLLIDAIESASTTCGESDGALMLKVSGFTGLTKILLNEEEYVDEFTFNNLRAGEYTFSIVDELGCGVDSTTVLKSRDCPIFIPNIFSPNGDEVNDVFSITPHPDFIGDFRNFAVYDRWGALLFMIENFDPETMFWDGTFNGKDLATGVYVYYLEYQVEDGSMRSTKGDVTIIDK